jgi:hypothetical protein
MANVNSVGFVLGESGRLVLLIRILYICFICFFELRLGHMFDNILFKIMSEHRTEINRDTLQEKGTIS